MQFSIEKAAKLVNKSVKTLYRHMSTSGLRYSLDENKSRKLSLDELQSFYGLEIEQDLPDSQVRFSPENDVENKLELLTELTQELIGVAKMQLTATNRNNELLEQQNEKLDSQLRIGTKPDLVVQEVKTSGEALAEKAVEAAIEIDVPVSPVTAPLTSSYLDDIPSFLGKR